MKIDSFSRGGWQLATLLAFLVWGCGDDGGAAPSAGAAGAGGVQSGGSSGVQSGGSSGVQAGGTGGVQAGGTGGVQAGGTGGAGGGTGGGVPTYTGFTLVLDQEFDAPLNLASDLVWTYSDGNTDSMYTRFAKDAISFSNGMAVLTATKPGVSGGTSFAEGVQANFPVSMGTSQVKSGELRTKYQNYRYGRYEARMKVAKNVNVITAFFTFRNPKWQEWRELDVEVTPANPAQNCGSNIVWANNCGAYGCTQNDYPGGGQKVPSLTGSATIYDDFHIYSMVNEETKATWYVDGSLIRTDTSSKLPKEQSMKIIFNLWVFNSSGWGGGDPEQKTYPMSAQIDWVRFYKKDTDTTYPCSPLPTCQPAADRDYQKNNAEDGLPSAAPW